MPTKLLKD